MLLFFKFVGVLIFACAIVLMFKNTTDNCRIDNRDTLYQIQIQHRMPTISFKEYIQLEDRGLTDMMIRTRLTFKNQPYIGTVLRDGFHVELPDNAMWKDGTIVVGDDVRNQIQLAKTQPAS
jgi:hypothetical protein